MWSPASKLSLIRIARHNLEEPLDPERLCFAHRLWDEECTLKWR